MASPAAPNLGDFGPASVNPLFSLSPDILTAARAAGDGLLPAETRAQVGEAETALAAIREALNSVDDPAVRSALQANQLDLGGALANARLTGSTAALSAINIQQIRMQADAAIAQDIQNGLGGEVEGAGEAYEALRREEYEDMAEEERYASNYDLAASSDPFFNSYSDEQQQFILADTDKAGMRDPAFGRTLAEVKALSPEQRKAAQDERQEAYTRLTGLQQADPANAAVIGDVMKHSHHSLTAAERVKLETAAKTGDPAAYRELLDSVQGREKHNAFAAAQTLDVGRDVGFDPKTPDEAAAHIVYDTQDQKYDVSIGRLSKAVQDNGGDEKKAFASLAPDDQKNVYNFRLSNQVAIRGAAESLVSYAREANKGLGMSVAEKAEFVNGTAQQNIDMLATKHGVTDPAKQHALAAMLIPLDGKTEAKEKMVDTLLDKKLSAADREAKMSAIYEQATGQKPSLSREVAYYNAIDGLDAKSYSAAGVKEQMAKVMEAGKAETGKIDMEAQLREKGMSEEEIRATGDVKSRRTTASQIYATHSAVMIEKASAMPDGPAKDELMQRGTIYKDKAQAEKQKEEGEAHFRNAGKDAWGKLSAEQQKTFGSPEKYAEEMRKIDGSTALNTKSALEHGAISGSAADRTSDMLDARQKFNDARAAIYDHGTDAAKAHVANSVHDMAERAASKVEAQEKAKAAVVDLKTEVSGATEAKEGEPQSAKTAAVSAEKAKEKQEAQKKAHA